MKKVKISNPNSKNGVTLALASCFCSCGHCRETCGHHLVNCCGTWTWAEFYNLNHVVRLSCTPMAKKHFIVKWAILSNVSCGRSKSPTGFGGSWSFWGVCHLWQSVTEGRDKNGADPVLFPCFSLITSVQPWVIFTLSSCRDGTLCQRASNPPVLDGPE